MLQERIHERVVEETILLRVPQTKKDIVDVLVPHIKEGTLEEVSVPQFQEHTLGSREVHATGACATA